MSAIDDHSLLAMRDARMSVDSIAQTMGWGFSRTKRRLEHLAALEAAGVSAHGEAPCPARRPQAGDGEPGGLEPLTEIAPEAPIAPGQGRVLRTFVVPAGGYGAACEIADGRHVYTLIGPIPLETGVRIPVLQVGDVWRRARTPADA
jgi:hypothetical protein